MGATNWLYLNGNGNYYSPVEFREKLFFKQKKEKKTFYVN